MKKDTLLRVDGRTVTDGITCVKLRRDFFWFLRFYVEIVRFSSYRLFVTYRIHRIYLVECAGGADTCS